MIITQGGWFGGFGLMLLNGKPTFVYSRSHYPEHKYKVAANHKIPEGNHTLVMDFNYDGGGVGKGGTATLLVDGNEVAKGRIDETVPTRFSMTEGLEVGRDAGMPVSKDYQIPFYFTGDIGKVIVKLQ
jgi:arylsulfatase